jgi:hypothetical protein
LVIHESITNPNHQSRITNGIHMDLLLLVLTVVAFVAAGGFAIVAWRLVREDRQRSAARVAALGAAIDAEVPPDAPPVAVASMFTMQPGASLQGRPLVKAAVVGVMAIVLVVAAAMGNRAPATPSNAAARGQAPLELMSMRHAREGTTLTVTGFVRNPAGGAEARRIVAVVFAFDRAGGFTASGRAPLDFAVLEPGDESPFVVTIPNVSDVAKYRVSFRTEHGMMRHVDRRAEHVQLAQQ